MEENQKIPMRSQVKKEDTWAIEDMYATVEDWEKDFAAAKKVAEEAADCLFSCIFIVIKVQSLRLCNCTYQSTLIYNQSNVKFIRHGHILFALTTRVWCCKSQSAITSFCYSHPKCLCLRN